MLKVWLNAFLRSCPISIAFFSLSLSPISFEILARQIFLCRPSLSSDMMTIQNCIVRLKKNFCPLTDVMSNPICSEEEKKYLQEHELVILKHITRVFPVLWPVATYSISAGPIMNLDFNCIRDFHEFKNSRYKQYNVPIHL